MSLLFNAQKVSIYRTVSVIENRKPVTYEELVASHVPCRITGTWDGVPRLFVSKHVIDTMLPAGLHRNYKVVVEDNNNGVYTQTYKINEEPIWPGGKMHHLEVSMNLEV